MTDQRDHLFISYASEDGAMADWLVRRLTAEGYRVWCDRFKLLGGERWPKNIDAAIKTRTFRMLALMSEASLRKANPAKERQLGLLIGQERREDFIIPLNLDHRKATELEWQMSDVQFIPFHRWDSGLGLLLHALQKIGTPRPLQVKGLAYAAETFLPAPVLSRDSERLYSNVYLVERLPGEVHRFEPSRPLFRVDTEKMKTRWAFYGIGSTRFLAFTAPPDHLVEDVSFTRTASWERNDTETVEDCDLNDVSTHLLRKTLLVGALARGLHLADDASTVFFPAGFLKNDTLKYRGYRAKRERLNVAGERKYGGSRFKYNLGVRFQTRTDIAALPSVQVQVRLEVTDTAAAILTHKQKNARRKVVTKWWWNHEWLSRQLAIMQYLADGERALVIGTHSADSVVLASEPLSAHVSPSVSDARLKQLRSKVLAMMATVALDDEDEEDLGETGEGEHENHT